MRTFRNVGCIVAMALPMAACSTGRENPQTVFNDFNNLMLAGGSEYRVPIDVVADSPSSPALMLATEAGSTGSVGTAAEIAELPTLDEEFIGTLLSLTDRGRVSMNAEEPGVWSVECVDFQPTENLFQQLIDTCWVSSVRMCLFHEDGQTPSEEQLLELVRGEEAAGFGERNNYGNVYEIVRGLNPELSGYGREIAYLTISALQLEQASSDQLWGFGLLQAQRYLSQFMGAEDLLASLAKGQPVILGMNWPMDPINEGEPFGHAVVLYKADFVLIPAEASTEKQLEEVEAAVNSVVVGRRLWKNLGELNSNQNTWDHIRNAAEITWERINYGWRQITSESDQAGRPYRLALRRVYVVDPLGENIMYERAEPLPRRAVVEGIDLPNHLQFAISREKALTIIPITNPNELDAVLGEQGSTGGYPPLPPPPGK